MRLKLIDKRSEAGDVVSHIFEPVEQMTWTAGQFLIYFLPHEKPDVRGKQRFFTISSSPYEKSIMLTTRVFVEQRSSFKQALEQLNPGDFVDVKGPDGDFILDEPTGQYVFIAGGIGVTPYRSIIGQLDFEKKPINIELLYANKNEEFPFRMFFEEVKQRNSNFNIKYIVSPQHIDTKYIEENIKDYLNKIFYVSGPEPMVESLYEMLKGMGIKEENIKTDYFPGYEAF